MCLIQLEFYILYIQEFRMKVHKITTRDKDYPDALRNIASQPKQLFYIGAPPIDLDQRPTVAIVGSRKVSHYGQQVTAELASALASRKITIVSGLALGVDAIAHQAALGAGGRAIAVLPCGLDKIYPATNYQLAKRILDQGGTLITEYPAGTEPFKQNFIARNRLIAGLAQATLITEAAEKSGSLHTANFALEQGKEVLAVPGNITSYLSAGTNNLIKSGATPITSAQDIFAVLNLTVQAEEEHEILAANEEEQIILKLLTSGVSDGTELLAGSKLKTALFNQTLTMMEITGKIKAAGNDQWRIA